MCINYPKFNHQIRFHRNTDPGAQITSIQTKAHGLYEQRSDKSDMTNDKWIEEIAPSHKRRIYFLTKYLKTITVSLLTVSRCHFVRLIPAQRTSGVILCKWPCKYVKLMLRRLISLIQSPFALKSKRHFVLGILSESRFKFKFMNILICTTR